MFLDPRLNRLRIQQELLEKLNHRSPFITIEPVDVIPGSPPERYQVSYNCLGIAEVKPTGEPVFSHHHILEIYLDQNYPKGIPQMKFLTPIWHPNISSREPRRVCTNQSQTWWAGKDLDDLVCYVGEMVQYKIYLAKLIPPFPLDQKVAEWVREVAEPNQWVGPDRPLDHRPLLKPNRIYQVETFPRIRFATPHLYPSPRPCRIQLE